MAYGPTCWPVTVTDWFDSGSRARVIYWSLQNFIGFGTLRFGIFRHARVVCYDKDMRTSTVKYQRYKRSYIQNWYIRHPISSVSSANAKRSCVHTKLCKSNGRLIYRVAPVWLVYLLIFRQDRLWDALRTVPTVRMCPSIWNLHRWNSFGFRPTQSRQWYCKGVCICSSFSLKQVRYLLKYSWKSPK